VTFVLAPADTVPNTNTGYVAAAYLVFFLLVFVYFAIMAAKLQRLERELVELNTLADRKLSSEPAAVPAAPPAAGLVEPTVP
jgi:CcmD family protein